MKYAELEEQEGDDQRYDDTDRYHFHGELVAAIEKKDKEKAAHISQRHMSRYSENIDAIRKMFPEYFND